jgi:hypothetical protein
MRGMGAERGGAGRRVDVEQQARKGSSNCTSRAFYSSSTDLAQDWLIRVAKFKVAPWVLEADGRPGV